MATNVIPENLNDRQRRAISALLTTANREQAAKAAGVSKTTIYRWFQQGQFVAALRDAEREALNDVSRQLVSACQLAVDTLKQGMKDPDASLSNRIRAAEAVLSRAIELRKFADLEDRLVELERKLK